MSFQSYNHQIRHQSTQLKKIIDELLGLCQDNNYKYIDNFISTNTKRTQTYFLLAYTVRTQRSSMHHVNLGSVDPIIGLDVLSGASPIDIEMVENPPISTQISKNKCNRITIRGQN